MLALSGVAGTQLVADRTDLNQRHLADRAVGNKVEVRRPAVGAGHHVGRRPAFWRLEIRRARWRHGARAARAGERGRWSDGRRACRRLLRTAGARWAGERPSSKSRRSIRRCQRWSIRRCQRWSIRRCQRWSIRRCQRWSIRRCQRWSIRRWRRWRRWWWRGHRGAQDTLPFSVTYAGLEAIQGAALRLARQELIEPARSRGVAELPRLDATQPPVCQGTAHELPALGRPWQTVCLDARAAHAIVILPAARARLALAAKALDVQLAKRASELDQEAVLLLVLRPCLGSIWRGGQRARRNLHIRRHESGAANHAARAKANDAVVAEVNVVWLPCRLQGHAHTSCHGIPGRQLCVPIPRAFLSAYCCCPVCAAGTRNASGFLACLLGLRGLRGLRRHGPAALPPNLVQHDRAGDGGIQRGDVPAHGHAYQQVAVLAHEPRDALFFTADHQRDRPGEIRHVEARLGGAFQPD